MANPEFKTGNQKSVLWLTLCLILFLAAFAWRAQNLDAFGTVNDEGAYLMWTRLAVDGYPLYAETRAVQPPLLFEYLGLAFRVAGQTIQTGRWAMLLGFIPFVGAVGWLAYRAGGWPAALTAVFLSGVAPIVFTFSRLVMAEVPATGLAVLAVAMVFEYIDRKQPVWLVTSGLALAASLLLKGLNPMVVVPVGLLLLLGRRETDQGVAFSYNWRGLLVDLLLWGGSVLVPLVAIFFIYDTAAMVNQVLAFRRDLRAAIPGSWAETWTQFSLFLASHWGFWLLAVGGIISGVLRARAARINQANQRWLGPTWPYPLVWAVWLVAGSAMLAWHSPLFTHQFVVLLPSLILLGAGFIADVMTMWRVDLGGRPAKILLSLIIVAAIFNLPAIVKANQQAATIVTGGREAEALKLLKAVSRPDDFLMGDSQLLIFLAGRRTPPPLGDVALVAVKAGWQTSDRMIALTRAYQSPAVVQWSLRLPWLPDYLAWVEDHYMARRTWDNDHIIYFAPRHPSDRPIPNERTVRLSDSIALRGYELDPIPVKAGQNLPVKVFWQTGAPLSDDFTIFTQLLDSNGLRIAGWDSEPLGGYFPTSRWPVNEVVADMVQLPVPADLPPGEYTLITGMYLLKTSERLATPTGSESLTLTTIQVER